MRRMEGPSKILRNNNSELICHFLFPDIHLTMEHSRYRPGIERSTSEQADLGIFSCSGNDFKRRDCKTWFIMLVAFDIVCRVFMCSSKKKKNTAPCFASVVKTNWRSVRKSGSDLATRNTYTLDDTNSSVLHCVKRASLLRRCCVT